MSDPINNPIPHTPTLHLVFSTQDLPKRSEAHVAEKLAAATKAADATHIKVNWKIQEARKCLGQIQFGDHHIQVAGLPNPLPPAIIDRTIHVAPWSPQVRAALRQHRSHLSLVYTGDNPDPVEKMIALYQVAHALTSEDLLGVVNEGAWTAHPTADFLSSEKIASYRQEIPFNLWFGYIKFFIDKQNYWLVTKGHHFFDVPDLAYFIQEGQDARDITAQFINIFYYIYEQDAEVTAGDTLEISGSGVLMKFSEVSDHEEYLMGPSGTLVIETITRDETNP